MIIGQRFGGPEGPSPNIKAEFITGNFDYLPDVVPDANIEFLQYRDYLLREVLPSDEYIPELPDDTVEALAEENIHEMERESILRTPTRIKLFAAVRLVHGLTLTTTAPDSDGHITTPIREAAVVPSPQISGRITGPNRQMLDIIHKELKIKAQPETGFKEVAPTVFGRPLALLGESTGTPAQTQRYKRFRLPLKGTWRVSDNIFRRAVLEELEIEYNDGRLNSIARLVQ